MGSIDDLLHSLLIRPEEQEGWEVRETEGERQGRRGGGEREGRITRRGQRRLLGDEGDYDEREREKGRGLLSLHLPQEPEQEPAPLDPRLAPSSG